MKNIFIYQRDHIAKIVCMVLAFLLWFYVQSTKSTKNEYPILLDVQRSLASNLIISEISNTYVMVAVEGKKQFLQGIDIKKDVKAYVDFQNPVLGKKHKYKIKIDTHLLPEGITFKQTKENVTAIVERKVKKTIPVVPYFTGNVAEGLHIGEYSVTPSEVTVEGPQSLMESINEFRTNEISISNKKRDIVKVAGIDFRRLSQYVPSKNVKVQLYVYDPNKCVEVEVPINIIRMKEKFNYVLGQKTAVYTLRLKKESRLDISEIDSNIIYPYIDVSEIDLSKFILIKKINNIEVTVPLQYKLNMNELTVVKKNVDTVKVTISKKE